MRAFVNTLLNTDTAPVVTVTAGLDRIQPRSGEDRIRVRNLLAEARRQVTAIPDPDVAQRLVERLEVAEALVELGGGAHGLIVVVTPVSTEVRSLPFPVGNSVSVGPTPATRSLIQGLRRSPRYRVLVLSDRSTRLFDAVRDELVEVVDHGFPMSIEGQPRRIRGRFAPARGNEAKDRRRRVYRQVDRGLTIASRSDELPLVLVGVRRSALLFEEVSDNTRHVVGIVNGARDRASASQLGRTVWPIMRTELRGSRAKAIDELAAAAGRGAAVTGIDEVWQLGREGRGRLLVVEEDYRAMPSHERDGRLVDTDDTTPEVLDDPVDEIVEHVLRAGGSVEFVARGELAALGQIGLILR